MDDYKELMNHAKGNREIFLKQQKRRLAVRASFANENPERDQLERIYNLIFRKSTDVVKIKKIKSRRLKMRIKTKILRKKPKYRRNSKF